jgi:hypothetical protein
MIDLVSSAPTRGESWVTRYDPTGTLGDAFQTRTGRG